MENKNLIFGLVALLAIVGIVIISGCIGGGETEKGQTDDGSKSTSSGDAEKPLGDSTPPVKETPAEGEPSAEDTTKSFADVFALGKPTGYTISYDTQMKVDKINAVTKTTVYLSGEKMRTDIFSSGDIVSSAFVLGDNAYTTCMKEGRQWMCITSKNLPQEEEQDDELREVSDVFEGNPQMPNYDGKQNIAGFPAECYSMESEGMKYRYCIHPQKYLMLLIEIYSGGELEYKMVATNVDLSLPSDDVFKLPAEPMVIDVGEIIKDVCAMCANIPEGESKSQCMENCKKYQ